VTDQENKFANSSWALTGKILTGILTALVAIICIYTFFSQKEEKLSARGIDSVFVLPLDAKKAGEVTTDEDLLKEIDEKLRPIIKNNNATDVTNVRTSIENLVREKEKVQKQKISAILNFKGFTEVTVVNDGTKQADNVSLELYGSSGYYNFAKSSINEDLKEFNSSIPLGNIRPSVVTTVYIWNRTRVPLI
jgi:hypothetical protein